MDSQPPPTESEEPCEAEAGLLGSVRRLADTGLAMVENRVELFAVEMLEEKVRLVQNLVLASVAILLGFLAMTMLTLLVVVFLFEGKAQVWALAVFGVMYFLAALGCIYWLMQRIKNRPPPLGETLAQLRKDREWIRSRK